MAESFCYLIKLYTLNQESLFGSINHGHVELSGMGQIAADEWVRLSQSYQGVELDQWLILPDHLEAIVTIRVLPDSNQYISRHRKPRLLSAFIASYKALAAKRINLLRNDPGRLIWQRSYQERFIPDEATLGRTRQLLLQQNTFETRVV